MRRGRRVGPHVDPRTPTGTRPTDRVGGGETPPHAGGRSRPLCRRLLVRGATGAGGQRAELGLRVRVAAVRRVRAVHVVADPPPEPTQAAGGACAEGGGTRARRDAE